MKPRPYVVVYEKNYNRRVIYLVSMVRAISREDAQAIAEANRPVDAKIRSLLPLWLEHLDAYQYVELTDWLA